MKKVFILGAGYAGIETALSLQRKKKKSDDMELYLIDRNPYHTLLTELHEVAGNRVDEETVIVSLKDIFRYTDVHLIQDEIGSIDFDKRTLTSERETYHFDYLVISTGSEPNFFGIPGLKENSLTLWSYHDAIKMREHIRKCFERASMERDQKKRKALLTFAIGGGGFTGVELAGELAHWTRDLSEEYSIGRGEAHIIIIEALPKILSNLKDEGIRKATDYLTNKLGIEILTESAVVKVNPGSLELKSGRVIETESLLWTAGVKANDFASKLNIEHGRADRIKVNEYTETQYKNVYSVGDASLFHSEKSGTLPALVESALQTGKTAAKNILNDIRGKEKVKLEPKLHGVMVSLGSMYAVADIMGIKMSSFFAVIMKYLVNIHYLFGIGGFEQVIKYIKDEILFKRHKRYFIEKHYISLTPIFWLVPLRLYLGFMWLMSGIDKFNKGWLTKAILTGSADAGTGASIAESGVQETMKIVSSHTPFWYAWIADNLIVPNALFFQYIMVATELGLGLAFMTGTFTFLAALASIALNINFLLSTGLYDLWFLIASIPMLGGAGRSFGIDHYLIPYLMRQWRYFVRNRKIKFWLWK